MEKKTVATGAEQVRWDLSDLYPDDALQTFKSDQEKLKSMSETFSARYRGKVASLGPSGLAEALADYEAIQDLGGRLGSYAYLSWSTDTLNPDNGRLLQQMTEFGSQLNQLLVFFSVEWVAVDDAVAQKWIDSPELAKWRHYLEVSRLYKPHTLEEKQEQVLSRKSVTGRSAWVRFFDETLGAATFELDGETLPEQEVLSKLHSPDRGLRQRAAASLTAGLKGLSRTLTFVFNTLAADKQISDEMRGYAHWLASRNLSNEIADEAVNALVQAVTGRYDLAQRYYRLKSRLLGLEGEMKDYDRYAPVFRSEAVVSWNEAREMVVAAYGEFHPEMGRIVSEFFEQNWIDAAIVPGKRSGAFSASTVPSVHPYILMNYDGRIRDVQTLAHELGHGIHQYLSRGQGVLQADTPLTTAETASVFGEMLVFQRLYAAIDDPKERLGMLVGKIDDTMATVYRQIAMNRFEDGLHTARRTEGELTADQISAIWRQTQEQLYGDSVQLTEDYGLWWSYIPHFLHTPGYVYAYAFGELLVMALYEAFRRQPEGFQARYVEMLSAGGSDWPQNVVAKTGLDITDPGFWKQGLAVIERMLAEAEDLAAQVINDGGEE